MFFCNILSPLLVTREVGQRLSASLFSTCCLSCWQQWHSCKWNTRENGKVFRCWINFHLELDSWITRKYYPKHFVQQVCEEAQKRHKEHGFLSSILSISFCYKYPWRLHCSQHPVWRGRCSRQGSCNFVSHYFILSEWNLISLQDVTEIIKEVWQVFNSTGVRCTPEGCFCNSVFRFTTAQVPHFSGSICQGCFCLDP